MHLCLLSWPLMHSALKIQTGRQFCLLRGTYFFDIPNLSSMGCHLLPVIVLEMFQHFGTKQQQKVPDENVLLLKHCVAKVTKDLSVV